MTNGTNTAKHFDLHTTGIGYINRAREVKPQTGKKFKPFWSVGISALHGHVDEVEYTRIDTRIVGNDALALIKEYKVKINQQDTRVLCGFKVGDIYAEPYQNTSGENRAIIKGRLLFINWMKIDGVMVYKAQPPQGSLPEATTTSQKQANKSEVCPFTEQLGKQITLLTADPDFDTKTEWLKNNGYEFDINNKVWNLVNS